jgi:hypothetical protein
MSLRVFEKESIVTGRRFAALLPLTMTCQERVLSKAEAVTN